MPDQQRRRKRADAQANRERLLDVAGALIAERGIDVPLAVVTREAGVGAGTLYRHFPDRDALILGLAQRAAGWFAEVAQEAAVAGSGWDALVTYIDGVVAITRDAPWVTAVLDQVRRRRPAGWDSERWNAPVIAALEQAQKEGSVRPDVTVTDVVFIPIMLTRLLGYPHHVVDVVLPRQRALLLDALRPEGAKRPPLDDRSLAVERLSTLYRKPSGPTSR